MIKLNTDVYFILHRELDRETARRLAYTIEKAFKAELEEKVQNVMGILFDLNRDSVATEHLMKFVRNLESHPPPYGFGSSDKDAQGSHDVAALLSRRIFEVRPTNHMEFAADDPRAKADRVGVQKEYIPKEDPGEVRDLGLQEQEVAPSQKEQPQLTTTRLEELCKVQEDFARSAREDDFKRRMAEGFHALVESHTKQLESINTMLNNHMASVGRAVESIGTFSKNAIISQEQRDNRYDQREDDQYRQKLAHSILLKKLEITPTMDKRTVVEEALQIADWFIKELAGELPDD